MPVVRRLITLVACALVVLPGAAVIAMQVTGDSWTSPTYGFSLSWAGTTWEPAPDGTLTAAGPERLDRLHLVNGTSSLYFEGATRYAGDVSSCVGTEANLLSQESGVTGIRPYRDEEGAEVVTTGTDSEAAAFTLTLAAGTEAVELVDYVECRALIPGQAVLIVTLVTEPGAFKAELATAQDVIATITMPTDRPADPLMVYGAWIAAAQTRPSVAGPLSGELNFGPGNLAASRAGVDEPDFYARAEFSSPDPATAPWDIGIGFRDSGGEEQLRLIVDSAGIWFFKNGQGEIISRGTVSDFESAASDSNIIEVVATGDTGYFAFNERLIDALDLSSRAAGGDVFVGAGYFNEDAVQPSTIRYSDFQVWSLAGLGENEGAPPVIAFDATDYGDIVAAAMAGSPIAGPLTGELVQSVDATALAPAGVDVQDFVARATFINPSDAAVQPWDFGIAFREQENGDHYRLTIGSDGTWEFQNGLQADLGTGSVPSMSFEEGAANTLEVAVVGDSAAFSLNGSFIALLDAGDLHGASDVWVGAGFHLADTDEGAVTQYQDFAVWPVDFTAFAASGETPAATAEAEATPAPLGTPVAVGDLQSGQVAVELNEQDGSGVDGLAVLSQSGEMTTVAIVSRGANGEEVAVVHRGTCQAISTLPAFLLSPLDPAGNSETTVQAPLRELTDGGHAIAIHRSAVDYVRVVACGDVPAGS